MLKVRGTIAWAGTPLTDQWRGPALSPLPLLFPPPGMLSLSPSTLVRILPALGPLLQEPSSLPTYTSLRPMEAASPASSLMAPPSASDLSYLGTHGASKASVN